MADQRQPFRFRLPWGLPPAPTPANAPAVSEPRAIRQPAAAIPRPPFRPAGAAPRAAAQPSTPRATTEPSTGTRKPISPPKLPPSQPLVATNGSPSATSTSIEGITTNSRTISPPKPARRSPSPLSLGPASKPPSPSHTPALSNPSTPSSSSPPSPQHKAPTQPISPPKPARRSPSPLSLGPASKPPSPSHTPENPAPVTFADQSLSQPHAAVVSEDSSDSSREPIQSSGESTPDHKEVQEMKGVLDSPMMHQNGEPEIKEVATQLPESNFAAKPEAAIHPVAVTRGQSREEVFHRKEVIATSGAGKKPAGRPHNHRSGGEKAPLQKEIKDDVSKFVHKLGVGQGMQPLDGDKQVTIITLVGENKGASMTLGNEARKRESSIHIHRGYKANPDESVETSTDGEGTSKGKGKGKLSDSKTDDETATKAYINSNVQGVNNSLVLNGSVSTMNPGVHYVRFRNQPESSEGRHEEGSYETHKAECSATQSEKLAFAPSVRRRCLGGLFMDSSDSDADKPEMPRRHGCRYRSKD